MTGAESKIAAAQLEAVFLRRPVSLVCRFGTGAKELLLRLENLEAAAAKGSTAGIPLLILN
jgi:hypothetical protein